MSREITIKHGKVFAETLQAVDDGCKVIVHKGGTGSGKTFDIMTFLLAYANSNPNSIVTVVSESRPHLDIGAIRILRHQLIYAGIFEDSRFNKTSGTYTFDNGSIIEFFSADRIGKAVGARRDVLYGNEVNHLKVDVWDELARRSELVIADFNPTSEFWLDQWLSYNENVRVITSNYLDNPFLPDTETRKIKRRADMDGNFYRVHILCEYGTSEGLVLPEFSVVDVFPEDCGTVVYGLDFGYSNDPAALVKVGIQGGVIYVDELIYDVELTNQDIGERLRRLGLTRKDKIYADAAEPKSIEEIYRMGFNIRKADKGQVMFGIDLLRQYQIKVVSSALNVIHELRNYVFMTDKNNKAVNKPIDDFNHAIDALRYAVVTEITGRTGKIIKTGW